MKNFSILSVVLATLINTSYAKDIEPGTLILSGDLDLSLISEIRKVDNDKTTSGATSVKTSILYHLSPFFGVGFIWQHNSEKRKDNGETINFSNNIIGPSIGLNFGITDNVNIGITSSIAKSVGKYSATGVSSVQLEGFAYINRAFVSYYLNEKVSIDTFVAQITADEEYDVAPVTVDTSVIATGLSLSAYF